MFSKLNTLTIFTFIAAMLFVACSDDTSDPAPEPTVEEEPKPNLSTEGFVITGNIGETGVFAYYSKEIPTGSIDLSSGTDFQQFFPTSIHNSAMYTTRTDGNPGFAKIVVDTLGNFREEGIIVTNDAPGLLSFRIAVRDDSTGVYQDRSRPNTIVVFDPATLETIAEIDMSAATEPLEGVESRFQRFVFRGDDVFMSTRGNINGELYSGFYLQAASLATNSFLGTTSVAAPASGGLFTVNNFGQGLVDTNGDLYFQDGGAVGSGTFSRIYKIPAGTNEIDESYNFRPPFQLAPDNVFYPVMSGFKIVAPGKAIAKVNSFVPQTVIDIILALPGDSFNEKLFSLQQNPETLNQILGILFTAESAAWCELDLINQTTTIIEGAPLLGALATGNVIFEHEGEIYFPIATSTEQAIYKYTPGIPSAMKAFDVTGGDLVGGLNIANNN